MLCLLRRCGSIKCKIKKAVNLKADYEYTHGSKLEPRRFVIIIVITRIGMIYLRINKKIGVSTDIINGTRNWHKLSLSFRYKGIVKYCYL